MIVSAFRIDTAIRNAHVQRTAPRRKVTTELRGTRTARPYAWPPLMAPTNVADRGYCHGCEATRFPFRPESVPLAVHHDRFEINNQIVVASYPDDQFGTEPGGIAKPAIVSPNILIHDAIVDSVVPSFLHRYLVGAHGNDCAGFQSGHSFPVGVAIPVSIPIAILP